MDLKFKDFLHNIFDSFEEKVGIFSFPLHTYCQIFDQFEFQMDNKKISEWCLNKIKQDGRLAPAYFSPEYKYFDQHLQTVKNEATV